MQQLAFGSAVAALVLVLSPAAMEEEPSPRRWAFESPRDYRGPVRRAAFDEGRILLATGSTLHRAGDQGLEPISTQRGAGEILALAPGGGIFARLAPVARSDGAWRISLFDTTSRQLAELEPTTGGPGFQTIHLGWQGRIILTTEALGDPRASARRLRHVLWSQAGEPLWERDFAAPHHVSMAEDGSAVVVAHAEGLLALDGEGRAPRSRTWEELELGSAGSPLRVREIAVAPDGRFTLINPAPASFKDPTAAQETIRKVIIAPASGSPTTVTLPTPVHHFRVARDGSEALVAGDAGRYFILAPTTGKLQEQPRLGLPDFVTINDLELLSGGLIALGLVHRTGTPPGHTWSKWSVVIVNREGQIVHSDELPVQGRAFGPFPSIDVDPASPSLVAYTMDRTIHLRIVP